MAVLPPDPIFCFRGDMGHIHSLCFPKTKYEQTTQLLAATENGNVYIWDLESNRLQHKQNMGTSIQSVHSIDNDIFTQEKSGLVTRWVVDESTYVADATYDCGGGFCKSILVDDCFVVPQQDSLDLVNLSTMEMERRLEVGADEKYGNVMAIQHIKVGATECILGGYETGDIILWDYNTGKQAGHLKLRDHITSLTFDPSTLRGVCGNATNILEVFSIDKELNMKLKGEISMTNEGCNIVKLRPSDRKILISGGWDGKIRIYSWKTLRVLVVLNEHKNAVTDIQFSPHPVKYWESPIFAASGGDGKISLWKIYN